MDRVNSHDSNFPFGAVGPGMSLLARRLREAGSASVIVSGSTVEREMRRKETRGTVKCTSLWYI